MCVMTVMTFKTPEITFRASENMTPYFILFGIYIVFFFLQIEHRCQELTYNYHGTTFTDMTYPAMSNM